MVKCLFKTLSNWRVGIGLREDDTFWCFSTSLQRTCDVDHMKWIISLARHDTFGLHSCFCGALNVHDSESGGPQTRHILP